VAHLAATAAPLNQIKKRESANGVNMSHRAWIYIFGIILSGALLSVLAFQHPVASSGNVPAFIVLVILATGAHLLKALFKSRHHSDQGATVYTPVLIFLFAGVILLPPSLYVLLVLIPHLVEWIKERYQNSSHLPLWYIQPFNISTHIICGLLVQQAYWMVRAQNWSHELPFAFITLLGAAALYVALNHGLIGLVMVLARGVTWQDSGVLDWANLSSDLIMIVMGSASALLWTMNPWLITLGLAPLILVQRSLIVPQLQKEARVDAKTGLWNAHHFAELFKAEFNRAQRFERPLALIMSDLDLLRNINNTYGHLAGDAVLERIGEIIQRTVREYDIAARFGGEEFAIALPETRPFDAMALAERLRVAVESTEFHAKSTPALIHVTISLGVAYYPLDADSTADLIHAADIAVYQAKLKGRNRVISSSELPRALELETAAANGRLEPSHHDFFHDAAAQDDLRQFKTGPRPACANGGPAPGEDSVPDADAYPAALLPKPEGVGSPLSLAAATRARRPEPKPNHRPHPPLPRTHRALFPLFVSTVVAAGLLVLIGALWSGVRVDLVTIAIFAALAVGSELLQLNLAEEVSVSVSVAILFASVLVAGVPGLLVTSAASALSHRVRPNVAVYKTAFNWSTHTLAGLSLVLIMRLLEIPIEPANLPVLLVVSVAGSLFYFAIESGLVATAISLSEGTRLPFVWRENFSWLVGHYVVLGLMGLLMAVAYSTLGIIGILVFALPAIMMRYALLQYVDQTRSSMLELKRMNAQLEQANAEVLHASQSIHQLNDELFLTVAKILDARDPYVAGHASQVAKYATAIAKELALPEERVEQVRQAALLHDIGKIGIPEVILSKPAKLSQSEYERMKTHAGLGGELLETSQGLRHLASFVKYHHERWDGKGYPEGLRGEQIPLEARILAVCDAVEAMASDRPYHRALSPSEIIREIARCSGTQFDPEVVETFVSIAEREGAKLIVNSAREVLSRQNHKDFGLVHQHDQALGTVGA
jgi:diguanylate cyclase (GGDEF)-like protein/putative nucleotidyltransferase with HDIG domain